MSFHSKRIQLFRLVRTQAGLMGVSRVGILVKNLLIKTDRLFHIVVVCTEWPTKILLERLGSLLSENFEVRMNE